MYTGGKCICVCNILRYACAGYGMGIVAGRGIAAIACLFLDKVGADVVRGNIVQQTKLPGFTPREKRLKHPAIKFQCARLESFSLAAETEKIVGDRNCGD